MSAAGGNIRPVPATETGTVRSIPSRGFTCAVEHVQQVDDGLVIGGIAFGVIHEADGEQRYFISLRHADGTMLTGTLSEGSLDRLARMMAAGVEGDLGAAIGGVSLVQ